MFNTPENLLHLARARLGAAQLQRGLSCKGIQRLNQPAGGFLAVLKNTPRLCENASKPDNPLGFRSAEPSVTGHSPCECPAWDFNDLSNIREIKMERVRETFKRAGRNTLPHNFRHNEVVGVRKIGNGHGWHLAAYYSRQMTEGQGTQKLLGSIKRQRSCSLIETR